MTEEKTCTACVRVCTGLPMSNCPVSGYLASDRCFTTTFKFRGGLGKEFRVLFFGVSFTVVNPQQNRLVKEVFEYVLA